MSSRTSSPRSSPAGRGGRPDAVAAIGVGAAGFVVGPTGATVAFSPHLSWRNEPLRTALSSGRTTPIVVDNDANAAAWAEWRFGAGAARPIVVMVDPRHRHRRRLLVDGASTAAATAWPVSSGTCRSCPAGTAASAATGAAGSSTPPATPWSARPGLYAAGSPDGSDLRARVGGEAAGLTGPLITEAARAGDRVAGRAARRDRPLARRRYREPGCGLRPGHVRRGGRGERSRSPAARPCPRHLSSQLTGRGYRTEARIVAAELGNEAGLIGAADLARLELMDRVEPSRWPSPAIPVHDLVERLLFGVLKLAAEAADRRVADPPGRWRRSRRGTRGPAGPGLGRQRPTTRTDSKVVGAQDHADGRLPKVVHEPVSATCSCGSWNDQRESAAATAKCSPAPTPDLRELGTAPGR